jgi:hypothetical protein
VFRPLLSLHSIYSRLHFVSFRFLGIPIFGSFASHPCQTTLLPTFTASFLPTLHIHDFGLHFNFHTLHTAAMLHLAMAFDFRGATPTTTLISHATNMILCWSAVDSVAVLGGTMGTRRHVGVWRKGSDASHVGKVQRDIFQLNQ